MLKQYKDAWIKILTGGEFRSAKRYENIFPNSGCALCALANAVQFPECLVNGSTTLARTPMYSGAVFSTNEEWVSRRKGPSPAAVQRLGSSFEELNTIEKLYMQWAEEDNSTAYARIAAWIEEHVSTEEDPEEPAPISNQELFDYCSTAIYDGRTEVLQ